MFRIRAEYLAASVLAIDVFLRFAANEIFAPGKITDPSHVLFFGNVHHPSGVLAFGLSTVEWLLIALAVSTAFYVTTLLIGKLGSVRDTKSFWVLKVSMSIPFGLAIINLAESILFGRVTDYLGLIHSESQFIAVNVGDLALWTSLLFAPFAAAASLILVVHSHSTRAPDKST
jgi:hypothetical protein